MNTSDDKSAEIKVIVLGVMEGAYEMANRVYDKQGLAPTIRTFQGGGLEPKIIVKDAAYE